MLNDRRSGVLLHLFSLPSDHGIGDMGKNAYAFVDRLVEAGQRYWQILPLNPGNPDSGESPYFSSSAFAGNPCLLDLDALIDDGLLAQADLQPVPAFPSTEIHYEQVRQYKLPLLRKAADRFIDRGVPASFQSWRATQPWLNDFALFTALKSEYPGKSWSAWPAPLRGREPGALRDARRRLQAEISREEVLQFLFTQQWRRLKGYANDAGIQIFGDMPIYVSYESADVWADSRFFKLDDDYNPTGVSGVPPDYFSATGQLWNNPVYDWERLRETGYAWWIRRLEGLFERFDLVRIDHFRGLVQYWEVPAGEPTAIKGKWMDVPVYDFFDALQKSFERFPVVVEDLGLITPDVEAAKAHYGFPGMLVLQFAFSEAGDSNPYLPENHIENAVVYLGTHDNNTARGWYEQDASEAEKIRLKKYLPRRSDVHVEIRETVAEMIEMTLSSRANTAIVTAQDLLALPGRARINDPSDNFGNWKWRLSESEFARLDLKRLASLTRQTKRWRE